MDLNQNLAVDCTKFLSGWS